MNENKNKKIAIHNEGCLTKIMRHDLTPNYKLKYKFMVISYLPKKELIFSITFLKSKYHGTQ